MEKAVLPELTEYVKYWKRYGDYVMTKLNSFDKNIQFTFEEEDKGTLPFLDVLIHRNRNSVVTTIFWKPANNDIYLN